MHLFHDWTNWEQYTASKTYYHFGSGTQVPLNEHRQKRTCKTCGYVQDREVSEF